MRKILVYKNKVTNQFNKNIISHFAIWIVLIVYLYNTAQIKEIYPGKIIFNSILYVNHLVAFYGLIMFTLPKFWPKGKLLFFTFFIVQLLVYYFIGYLNSYFIYDVTILKIKPQLLFPSQRFFRIYSTWFFIICLVAFSYYFRKLKMQKIRLQNEKDTALLKKELFFFKNQFNPHVTFNFLNHIYSIANQCSKETARAIEKYSDMLRYYTSYAPEVTVQLKDEIRYLSNYISLRKILNKDVFVDIVTKGNLDGITIYPRVLITFVENAFKHGVYSTKENPIEIKLVITENQIEFYVKNMINKNKNVVSSGIGLENARQILNLHYSENYELITEEKENMYYSILRINS